MALRSALGFPYSLMAWAGLGIALNVGLARFAYGVMLPAVKRDLALDYLGGGALNAVHLAGYLAGTLAAPRLGRSLGMPGLSRWAHALVAAGALLCALAPAAPGWGPALLALGRTATGLGAGAGVVAILVLAFAAVPAAARPLASALVWSGMGFALVLSGLAAELLVETRVGWRATFGLSALLAAAIALGFPPRAEARPLAVAPHGERLDLSELRHGKWAFLLGAYFMFGAGYIAYATFAGTRLAASQAPTAVVSAMWVAFGAAMVAGMALCVPVLRREGSTKLALAGALGAGTLGALVSWSDAASAAAAGALLVGLGLATPTIVSAYARERCSEAQYPQAFSYATAAMGIGQLAGPLAAGALADGFGVAAVALFAFGAYALGALLAVADAVRGARAPTD